MRFSQTLGLAACMLILLSFFFNYAWYPDIDRHFTAFFSERNYYGKPGKLLTLFAVSGIVFYLVHKIWSQRLNLIFSALCMAYAIKTYLLFTSGYDGYVPRAETGIYLMLAGAALHMIAAITAMTVVKKNPEQPVLDNAVSAKPSQG